MKRKSFFLLLVSLFIISLLQAVSVNSQRVVTSIDSGKKVVFGESPYQEINNNVEIISRDSRVSTSWQTSDNSAVCEAVHLSTITQKSFVQWQLNNERVELFSDSSNPLWTYIVGDINFGFPSDMTEDGSTIAVGNINILLLFDSQSGIPVWEYDMGRLIEGVELSVSGDLVYVASYDETIEASYVQCFTANSTLPIWSTTYQGPITAFTASGDRSKLVMCQRGDVDTMWIINSDDGSVISEVSYNNQNKPALSYDGNVIVNGDYSGYVYLYEWNEQLLSYEETWSYHVNGDWIGGMSVSSDGSTIAVGTLIFLTNGYDGEIYLFDKNSPTPLWVYENAGDYVVSLDMTADGSMIASAEYGDINHTKPDFMLFRRESNIPVFEINSPGSFYSVDIAEDGSSCVVGGKAVHARVMGSGGLVYNIDCNLGGGFVNGTVNLEGSNDNSGVTIAIEEPEGYYDYSDIVGNFQINNAPAGTYNLVYSKVGYFSETQPVTIIEGETSTVSNISLSSCGAPPQNLSASQATETWVELNWEPPVSGTIEGYHIYRKRYISDNYPIVPLASVDVNQTSFIDNTAFPYVEYFYVVTGEVDAQSQTPYSNEAIGWTSTDFITNEINAYVGSEPTIDGIISAGEWDDAFSLDSSDFSGTYDNTPQPIGSVIGYFKINPEMTKLYVAYINYNDSELEDHDEVALYIDDNNDGEFSPESEANEGNYWAAYYASGNELKFRPIYDTGSVGNVQYLENPQLEISVETGYLVYEFVIPIGTEPWEINPSTDNMSSLAIFVLDDNAPDPNGFDGWWPMDNTNLFSPEGFGTITYGATSEIMYGDVDGNELIQAFDASMTLQDAVGLISFTPEQTIIADVDGNELIQAFDASLILQYAVGLITIFPVEEMRNNFIAPLAKISVEEINNELVFSTEGNLYAFEISVDGSLIEKASSKMLMEQNDNKVALASAQPITGEFLRIQMKNGNSKNENIKLNMIVNTEQLEISLNSAPAITFVGQYPNPFNPVCYFGINSNTIATAEISIYNIKGAKVASIDAQLKSGKNSIKWNANDNATGVYFYKINIEGKKSFGKMLLLK